MANRETIKQEVTQMRASVYCALVAKPVKFPDDLAFFLFPLQRRNESKIGGFYPLEDHQSWNWVQNRYAVNSEDEAHIKAGESIQVFRGMVTTGFPDGTKFPDGSDVTIVES
jgi:hypothetical protein